MNLVELSPADDAVEPEPFADADHPMRKVTREVAFEGGWSPGRARKVGELFDSMADGWAATHGDPVRLAPIGDGLRRGEVNTTGRWLELGSGTGAGTRILVPEVAKAVAVDLSADMLTNAPRELAPRVRADAERLPFTTDRFDGVLAVNMLLFPAEVDRVLGPEGRLLWVNTLGDRTPIHLSPADVLRALPGSWTGITARSGSGFWLSAARSTE